MTARAPMTARALVTARAGLRLLLACALGFAAALLVSCGSSGKGLIPGADAGPLRTDFEEVEQTAQAGNGTCSATEAALAKTESDFQALPSSLDAGLRNTLRQGIANLHTRALGVCSQSLSTTSSTGTTAKTTTATTQTTTVPTTTVTTPTTSTSTTTTPTTTITTPGPGGGTEAPGEEKPQGGGEGAGVGAGGGVGPGQGQGQGQEGGK
jgi:hypothetical protein